MKFIRVLKAENIKETIYNVHWDNDLNGLNETDHDTLYITKNKGLYYYISDYLQYESEVGFKSQESAINHYKNILNKDYGIDKDSINIGLDLD